MLVTLRKATLADAQQVLAWRNEPEVRATSGDSHEISPETHGAWFARQLDDPHCRLFIVEGQGRSLGTLRVDGRGGFAEMHIALSREARGRGIGRLAIRKGAIEAASALGAGQVGARVKRTNEASLKAFRACGFVEASRDGEWLELRLEVPTP